MATNFLQDFDRGWNAIAKLQHEPRRVVVISVPAVDPKTRAPYPVFLEYGHRIVPAGSKRRGMAGPIQGEANTRFEGPTKHYVEPRPFMAWTWEAHDSYKEVIKNLAHLLFVRAGQGQKFGEMATAELRQLGEQVVEDVRGTIQAMGLIDTGRMYRSVRCNVRIERGDGTPAAHSTIGTVGG